MWPARLLPFLNQMTSFRKINSRFETEWKQRLAQMDPWERLGIDWDDWHPAARKLLNDPFFWDQGSDYSPHGNDTGADLLADFKKWHGQHPQVPAHKWLVGYSGIGAWLRLTTKS